MPLLYKFETKATSNQHITPADRFQLSFGSLEELIAPDDPIRFSTYIGIYLIKVIGLIWGRMIVF